MNAGRHGPSIAMFCLTAGLLLAADLVGKNMAFESVGDRPVDLARDHEEMATPPLPGPQGRLAIPADRPDLIPQAADGKPVVPHVLNLRLTTNTGAVFGLGKGGQWIFATVSLLAVVVIVRLFWRSQSRAWMFHLCLAMILAGALGNMYDRMRFGAVRDFLYLFPGTDLPLGWHWPSGDSRLYPWIFNIADAALVVGVLLLMLIMWRGEPLRQRRTSEPPPPSEETAPH